MSIENEARAEAARQRDEEWAGAKAEYHDAGWEDPPSEFEEMFWEAGFKRGMVNGARWASQREPSPQEIERAGVALYKADHPAYKLDTFENVPFLGTVLAYRDRARAALLAALAARNTGRTEQ